MNLREKGGTTPAGEVPRKDDQTVQMTTSAQAGEQAQAGGTPGLPAAVQEPAVRNLCLSMIRSSLRLSALHWYRTSLLRA